MDQPDRNDDDSTDHRSGKEQGGRTFNRRELILGAAAGMGVAAGLLAPGATAHAVNRRSLGRFNDVAAQSTGRTVRVSSFGRIGKVIESEGSISSGSSVLKLRSAAEVRK